VEITPKVGLRRQFLGEVPFHQLANISDAIPHSGIFHRLPKRWWSAGPWPRGRSEAVPPKFCCYH